ncbi:MAG TPA: alpha/beta fold hydrolase [Pseudonocardia sp.]|uniref:alpha/beta fold hydrolase n=1 Tax=Pseudonocardia sp. TaxID=60912 RepID=UPI002D09AE32|nr:alpha/beta fold hydrolase [Pseudonocardia sp.]HTF49909.1 alpha/beta fold hydrolase [Pseudonocardia sp.]
MMTFFVARGEDLPLDAAARSASPSGFVRLSDGITEYRLSGPAGGDLVVLVPGLTVPLGYWDAVVDALNARGYRTLAYSGYGRGLSDRIHGRYDQPLFIRQLTELLAALDLDPACHLVGTSMGALVAMAYTAGAFTAPVSLTVIGPAGLSSASSTARRVLRFETLAALLGRRLGQRALRAHMGHNVHTEADSRRLTALVGQTYRHEGSIYALVCTVRDYPLAGQEQLYSRVGQLDLPKLLLWGEHDAVTPRDLMDQVRTLLRPAEAQVVADCGHMAPYEQPAVVTARLTQFFSTVEAKA